MLTDFKISSINETEKGVIVKVDFYKGNVTTEKETDERGVTRNVTRYRRLGFLRSASFTYKNGTKIEQIRDLLKAELAKDKVRDPIPEQSLG